MAEKTSIEWCDSTWNPWIGCQKVSPACDHCYAETFTARFGQVEWGPGKPRKRTSAANWRKPWTWARNAAAFYEQHGRRQRVFCASLADVFDNAVDPQWRADLFGLIHETPALDWLLLTKRIGNVQRMVEESGLERVPENVWLGATICNQEEADRDVPKLLATPAAVRFLSCEPLLGPVDLTRLEYEGVTLIDSLRGRHGLAADSADCNSLDWIIVGGESGPNARAMHPEWARSLRDQCEAAGVPFLFKQWGEYAPVDHTRIPTPRGKQAWVHVDTGRIIRIKREADFRPMESEEDKAGRSLYSLMLNVGKTRAGRLLDGREWNGFPGPMANR